MGPGFVEVLFQSFNKLHKSNSEQRYNFIMYNILQGRNYLLSNSAIPNLAQAETDNLLNKHWRHENQTYGLEIKTHNIYDK